MPQTIEPRLTPLTLHAARAADLMKPNPVSIRDDATVQEAVKLLTDKGFSAAPVIDEAGHPIGVLSRTDILVHQREKVQYLSPSPEYYELEDLRAGRWERLEATAFQVEKVDRTRVAEIMTPAVFSVSPDTPSDKVIEQMLALNVHRLFVVDPTGVLIGVISVMDILKAIG